MSEGRTRADVHAHNLEAVRAAVRDQGLHTRSAIAAATGLAKSSVSRLVAELIEDGVLREGVREPTGAHGRPSALVELTPEPLAGLGLEVRTDALAVSVVDTAGVLCHHAVRSMPIHVRRPARVLDELAALAEGAVAVATRGRLSLVGATLALAPELGWSESWLQGAISARLGRVTTVVAAATLAALAELVDPRGARLGDCFHVTAAGGISARLIVGGDVSGVGLDAFGHLCVEPAGRGCVCGRRGCLEAYVQRAAVLRDAGLGDARLTDLLTHAVAGELGAVMTLARSGRWLGVALANVVNLLAPPAIVLGGDFAMLARWIVPALRDELARRVLGHERGWPAVVVSRLGPEAAVIGAAATALRAPR